LLIFIIFVNDYPPVAEVNPIALKSLLVGSTTAFSVAPTNLICSWLKFIAWRERKHFLNIVFLPWLQRNPVSGKNPEESDDISTQKPG
jgi:hypothetical protein